ncbi:MAG: hypothetical protein HOP15_03880, partial [Planctomycetes bacterium]|nr:hypothetical protein [Planctomycetota bacterium]
MSTSLVPPVRRPSGRTIVAALALLALGVLGSAEKKPGQAPAPALEADSARRARTIRADWARITTGLTAEFFARHPDAAFERGWPGARSLGLSAFGDGSGLRWRNALVYARSELARLELTGASHKVRAPVGALTDWVEAELLLLDAQALPTRDAASYVQQALRTLRAAAGAGWLSAEERQAKLGALVAELPAYLDGARARLAPTPAWIELALDDLDDLEELSVELGPRPAPSPKAGGPRKKEMSAARAPEPLASIANFRAWLLGILANAGSRPPTLDASEWTRLVRLASGTAWEPGEIKALCLRDLAQVEPPQVGKAARGRKFQASKIQSKRKALRVRSGSTRALHIAQQARLLRARPDANSVTFGSEESPRTGIERVSLRPGISGTLEVWLQLPHRAWPAARTAARNQDLGASQMTALGVRHGLVGEALFELARLGSQDPLASLPVNRVASEAIGLYAQDWIARAKWVKNAFASNPRMRRALELQRAFEAARLLAALEMHAEEVSFEEAVANFARRTGAHEEVAAAEALRAQRDPLHGLGYLGWVELRALEQRLA